MKKMNIGFVGLRFGADVIAGLVNSSEGELIKVSAVCDIDREKADTCAARFSARAFYDIDNMLADPELDAIALITPPAGRAGLIDKVIASGRDVMTTKPFELDPSAAGDILKKARAAGRFIHMNSPAPVRRGLVCDLMAARDKYGLGIPVSWRQDIWVNYDEKPDGSWYDDPERCPVAPIFRLGIYIINDMVRVFGPAKKASVLSSRLITGRPTSDNSQLSILFENGATGSIFGSFCVDDSQRYNSPLVINFRSGTIYRNIAPGFRDLTLVTRDPGDERYNPAKNVVTKLPPPGESSSYQWEHFYKCWSERILNDPQYDRDIVEGLKIIKAMRESENTGKIIKL